MEGIKKKLNNLKIQVDEAQGRAEDLQKQNTDIKGERDQVS